ncbi:MAG: hypothetical protein CM15mP120_24720 [Pseudomonadota bacterium]|nr:MAG: hypothetical protein CM15mP120_24720 [Pseudomonadota bacterium]
MIPYYGYARQDRRPRSARVAISAKVVADMISSVGIDRILTVDLHADQIRASLTSLWITFTDHRCWLITYWRRITKTRSWYHLMLVVSFEQEQLPNRSMI